MKKSVLIFSTLLSVLALALIAANPVAAASYSVNAVQLNNNGKVIVYVEAGSSPYFSNTVTVSGFSVYPTTCVPNGAGVLACSIQGQIAQQHGGQTAYIIMNANGDKAWFVVPEDDRVPERRQGCRDECCGEECEPQRPQ
jgi:hypothetical protein